MGWGAASAPATAPPGSSRYGCPQRQCDRPFLLPVYPQSPPTPRPSPRLSLRLTALPCSGSACVGGIRQLIFTMPPLISASASALTLTCTPFSDTPTCPSRFTFIPETFTSPVADIVRLPVALTTMSFFDSIVIVVACASIVIVSPLLSLIVMPPPAS